MCSTFVLPECMVILVYLVQYKFPNKADKYILIRSPGVLCLFSVEDQVELVSNQMWDLLEGMDKIVVGSTCKLMASKRNLDDVDRF